MNKPVWQKHLNEKPQPRVKAKPEAAALAGVSQIGQALSYARSELFKGRALEPVGPTNNLVEGPGDGRDIHKHGGQGRH